jgi:hypothetical protein
MQIAVMLNLAEVNLAVAGQVEAGETQVWIVLLMPEMLVEVQTEEAPVVPVAEEIKYFLFIQNSFDTSK